MSSKLTDSSRCSCLSDDADIVDYSEAEQILEVIKTDLKSIQKEIKADLPNSCPTERSCKVSSVLVKLQNADSKLHQIIDLMESPQRPDAADDLTSNFGMSVKLDMAKKKLNDLKEKHEKLRREWHSQEEHLNKIAEAVAKKEHELKYQSVFCTTQGFVLSKMLWKSSKCDCLLEMMVSQEKLMLELIKTLDGCLYAFGRTYQNEMPEPAVDEYQYVLCLCGVLSNLASIPDGRFFLISQPICRDVYDQIIKMLPRILVPKAEGLKWIMLVAIYNIMICKEGREYAKSNRYLLQSLSKCIKPPHSKKIIILALKIIGNLTNDSSKAYIAHLGNILPLDRLSELQRSKDSCTIRKQATLILKNVGTEKLLHTIQLEQSKSRCNSACTQTFPKNKNPELFAYYVFTDTTNTLTSGYTTSASTMSSSWSDGSDYDPPDSPKSDFEESSVSKFSEKVATSSAPVPSYSPHVARRKLTSISAYNNEYLSSFGSSYTEDSSDYSQTRRRYITDISDYPEDLPEPLSGLSYSSSLIANRENINNPTPVSTITPIATYVDSLMLHTSDKKINSSSYNRKYEDVSASVPTVTPTSTYVNSSMFRSISTASNKNSGPYLPSCSPTRFESASTYVDSRMIPPIASSSNNGRASDQFTKPMAPYVNKEFTVPYAAPFSTYVDSSMFPTPSKQIKSNFSVNVQFNEKSSTLCHPSVWSIPAQPMNTFQEPTPSRSQEIGLLQYQIPQLDINKLLSITIGDNLQNSSLTKRNASNNTFPDGQSNPSIITVFRINNSKACLSPDNSSSPFGNTISTNTSFPWGVTVEDFLRISNKNIGTSPKTSRKHVAIHLSEPKNQEFFDAGYGGCYESYYEKLKKESCIRRVVNFEESHPQFHYEDVNMPSTSTGYYGYEALNPFAIYPNPNASSSSIFESDKENKLLPEESAPEKEEPCASCSQLKEQIPEPQKSQGCSPVASDNTWKCHISRLKTKPKKKPTFNVYNLGRVKKR